LIRLSDGVIQKRWNHLICGSELLMLFAKVSYAGLIGLKILRLPKPCQRVLLKRNGAPLQRQKVCVWRSTGSTNLRRDCSPEVLRDYKRVIEKDFKKLIAEEALGHAYIFYGGALSEELEAAKSLANFLEHKKWEVSGAVLLDSMLIDGTQLNLGVDVA